MEEKNYYINYEYNRSKRVKFFVLFTILLISVGTLIGMFAYMQQWYFVIFMIVILLFIGLLTPSMLKNYPIKRDNPILNVNGKSITANGKTYQAQDIEGVHCTILLSPVSKLDSENKQYIKEMASQMPEEQCFGTVDLILKAGPKAKKGEVVYLTLDDCLDATISLVNAGVKRYVIDFSLKKFNEKANFTITKVDKQKNTLSSTSQKQRMKQLL